MEYKAIKIPLYDYKTVEQARQQLAIKGIGKLPKELKEVKICPVCGSGLEELSIKYEYLQCPNPNCSYKQRNLTMNASGAFALGAIIGLGAAALLYLLARE